jgi:hypothetical protein
MREISWEYFTPDKKDNTHMNNFKPYNINKISFDSMIDSIAFYRVSMVFPSHRNATLETLLEDVNCMTSGDIPEKSNPFITIEVSDANLPELEKFSRYFNDWYIDTMVGGRHGGLDITDIIKNVKRTKVTNK